MLWLVERYFFWSTSKNDLRTFDNIQKLATSQGHYYPTGYLLDFLLAKMIKPYSKNW